MLVGGIILVMGHAASPQLSVEPEIGTIKSPATLVSDTTASGGKAIAFRAVTPTPTPTPTPVPSPSGQAMPVGDLAGWKQIYTDDFTSGNVSLGSFPGSYASKWDAGYSDGTPDSAGKTNGGKSGYYPSKVLSISGGVMDMYLHSSGGISMAAAPSPKVKTTWPFNGQIYGRYAVRFKSDSLKGFKTAWLLWPDTEQWSDGEIDFPEGDLSSNIGGFSHCVGNPSQNCLIAPSTATYSSWHTAVTEWSAGKVSFILDGVTIGSTTKSTPIKSMHYMLQTESCLTGCPAATTAGHLQIDWVALWAKV